MTTCSIRSRPGEYEEMRIVHTVKHHGSVIVLENVPAEVCSVCGDILLSLSTTEVIVTLLKNPGDFQNINL
ncbi:MAG: YgiT-type zinc finger protein [Syntrophobacteraceae bacterium]